MKNMTLALALVALTSSTLFAEDDLQAQKQAIYKEIAALRDKAIAGDPELSKQKAAIEDLKKKLQVAADESLKADPKLIELKAKLKVINDEMKKK